MTLCKNGLRAYLVLRNETSFLKKIICIAQTAMQQGCQILLGPNIPKREKL
jgi:hypothetical protein